MKILYGIAILFFLLWAVGKWTNTTTSVPNEDKRTAVEKALAIDRENKEAKKKGINLDCDRAQKQFNACDKYTGNTYIDCIVRIPVKAASRTDVIAATVPL